VRERRTVLITSLNGFALSLDDCVIELKGSCDRGADGGGGKVVKLRCSKYSTKRCGVVVREGYL
jgi:hypothetical protein